MRSSKEIISKVEQYCFCENKENQKRLDEALQKKENTEKEGEKKWEWDLIKQNYRREQEKLLLLHMEGHMTPQNQNLILNKIRDSKKNRRGSWFEAIF